MNDRDHLRECMLKEIDVLQDIIKRMATTSFLIKGWAVTLVVGTLVLKGGVYQVWIAFIPLGVFWLLDSYFLHQERMYRKLYDWVIANRLQTDEYLLDMNARRFEKQVPSKFRTAFSLTVGWLYGSMALMVVACLGVVFVTEVVIPVVIRIVTQKGGV
jgi:hypothetical protein